MLPIEIPTGELPVCELIDTELDVVCGGLAPLVGPIAINTGVQIAVPVVALNGILGSNVANIAQSMNQANFSALFAQI
jgi:hypothetical protein